LDFAFGARLLRIVRIEYLGKRETGDAAPEEEEGSHGEKKARGVFSDGS
jgi:hypothetical protein